MIKVVPYPKDDDDMPGMDEDGTASHGKRGSRSPSISRRSRATSVTSGKLET